MRSILHADFLVQRVNILKGVVLELGPPNWRVTEFDTGGFGLAPAEFARENRIVGGIV